MNVEGVEERSGRQKGKGLEVSHLGNGEGMGMNRRGEGKGK